MRNGFTLLELLVVIAIVSLLTAIAMPQFKAYRARGYDVVAQQDLHHVAIAEEAYYLDAERYLSCAGDSCTALPGITALSRGVQLNIAASDDAFTGTATHERGTGKTFTWDSDRGGMQP